MNDRMANLRKKIPFIVLFLSFTFVHSVVSAEESGFGFTHDPTLYAEKLPVVLFVSDGLGDLGTPVSGESSDFIRRYADAGIGNSLQIGVGRISNGWGFGLAGTVETLSPTSAGPSRAMADVRMNADLTIGYGRSFTLGPTSVSLGGEIVPKFSLRALDVHLPNVSAAASKPDAMPSVLKQIDRLNLGFGLGANLGAVVGKGMVRGSVSLRDIGHTRFLDYSTTLEDLRNGHIGIRVSEPGHQVPMTLGMGLHVRIPGDLSRTELLAEYVQPLAGPKLIESSRYIHVVDRLQIEIHSMISEHVVLRAGFREGLLSGGFDVSMDSVEMNAEFRSHGGGITLAVPY